MVGWVQVDIPARDENLGLWVLLDTKKSHIMSGHFQNPITNSNWTPPRPSRSDAKPDAKSVPVESGPRLPSEKSAAAATASAAAILAAEAAAEAAAARTLLVE